MIALTLPWLIFALIVIAAFFLYKRKWFVGGALIIISVFINWRAECIPFRLWPVNQTGRKNVLKVMSFNIDGSMERISNKAKDIANLIKTQNPDIIFLLEFSELYPAALDTLLTKDYPYTTYKNQVYYSHYFYSKCPIRDYKNIPSRRGGKCHFREGGFDINGTLIAIYGCHLPSNNYTVDRTYITPDSVRTWNDVITYIKDINEAYKQRAEETEFIKNEIVNQQYPIIIMGDFNDVGGCGAVQNIESAGLKDAWWEGGFGYGATIHKPLPYRIDHIMYSNELNLKSIKVVDSQGLSDHDALYAEFEY